MTVHIAQEGLNKEPAEVTEVAPWPVATSAKRSMEKEVDKSREALRWGVLFGELKLYPYKMQSDQTLTAAEKKRNTVSEIAARENRTWTKLSWESWTTDDTHLHLHDNVTTKDDV